ncbi:ferric reductase NAD binding domain-containing protein [Epithele typhae]|uniref:ferric reductase NAD binding domain-containing protein n=1 Tax=Epithele typhae TaxID=378194 RepID=UPI0020082352|nr:ferric reductase NAD binding domain-containing protein [Epithele typhae]KAH9915446.1 ferric reductase NAD binding domain-containing protein [Epithele typhae]
MGGPPRKAPVSAALRPTRYPLQIWWAIACFIAIIALFQFASWVAVKLRSRGAARTKGTPSVDAAEAGGAAGPTRGFALRNVPSAIVNAYRVVAFRWTITVKLGSVYTLNLAEVFVTCVYIIALFTSEFIYTTNPSTGKKWDPLYTGNRAGVIAVSQFPLITALGLKNNVISYVTGISYDKLNYIHRMAARVVFVMLWLHAGIRFYLLRPQELDEDWFRLGLMALVAFTILMAVSLRPVRSQHYEIFYFVHFLMVLIMLLGGYYHAERFKLGMWIWPSFLLWALDRFVRLARVVYYNHLYFGFHKTAHRLDASVELLSPHFVRLHIQRPAHFSWTPGQTAFLIMPTVSSFPLEAHPFTIASVDSRYQLEGAPKTPSLPPSPTTEDKAAAAADPDAAPFWKELVFLINIRGGFTRQLARAAQTGAKVKVLIDGPYGFSPDLDADDTVVLVAGGSGVTFTLSTLLGVLSHVQTGRSRCRRLLFVWSVRDQGHIEWVSTALATALELAPPAIDVAVRFFVTGRGAPAASEAPWGEGEGEGEDEDDSARSSTSADSAAEKPPAPGKPSRATAALLLQHPAVRTARGRPDLRALLREEVDGSRGRTSVTVCGSQGMARDCRAALRVPLARALAGGPSVVLHVESFGYA